MTAVLGKGNLSEESMIMGAANDPQIDPDKADWVGRLRPSVGTPDDGSNMQIRYTKHGMLVLLLPAAQIPFAGGACGGGS